MVDTAAPVRPEGSIPFIAGHITVQVNQFNCSQFATSGNKELAELITSGTKAHRGCIQLDPCV